MTGLPGVGKTTVVVKLACLLGPLAVGFYTEEIRAGGKRVGFEVVTLGGKRDLLAHVSISSPKRVGKYGVRPEGLQEALREMARALEENSPRCLIIDEIGKMELLVPGFAEAVLKALESPLPVVATVLARPHPFTDNLKRRSGVEVVEVTRENRNDLPHYLHGLLFAQIEKINEPSCKPGPLPPAP